MGMIEVDRARYGRGVTQPADPIEPASDPVSAVDVIGAAFGYDNTVVNVIDWMSRPQYTPDPDFNVMDAIKDTPYENNPNLFLGVRSKEEMQGVISRAQREDRWRRTIAAGGTFGFFAEMAAGTLDPFLLLPVGGWLKTATKGGQVVARAGEGAIVAAGSVAAQEALLHGTQETRTTVESVFAIGGAAILGSVLGGAAGLMTSASRSALEKRLIDIPGSAAEERVAWGKAVSAGAAAADDARGTGELKGALGAENAFSFQDPLIRSQTSPFVAARNAVRDLAETPLTLAENADGIATTIGGSVETRVKMAHAPLADAVRGMDQLYSDYFFGAQKRFAPIRGSMAAKRQGKMTYSQFKEAVSEAMWAGDRHPDPQVANAARLMREKVFDPLKRDAEETIPGFKDMTAAESADPGYLTRIWNRTAISARRNEFVQVLASHFESVTAALERRVVSLGKKAEEKQFEIDLSKSNVENELQRFRDRQTELRTRRAGASGEAKAARAALGKKMSEMSVAEKAANRAYLGQYRSLLADLKRGGPADKSPDIISYIRSRGGIRLAREGGQETAFAAELRDRVDKKTVRGVFSKRGVDPDLMRELAIDEGYLAPDASIDDLVSAIDDTLKGNPVRSRFDQDITERAARIQQLLRDFDEMGVDVSRLTPEELAQLMEGSGRAQVTPEMKRLSTEIDEVAQRFDDATLKVEDIDRLADDLKELAPDLVEAARAGRESARMASRELRALERQIADTRKIADLDPNEIRSLAEETTDVILGASPSRVLLPTDIVSGPRGPLKERTLRSLPTALVRDFVEKDVEVIARLYTRTMAADTNLVKAFGSTDMMDVIAKINDESARLASEAKTEKARSRINRQRDEAIRDITAMRDRIRGNYAIPDNPDGLLSRTGRVIRNLNYLRLLGGMTLSAVPDLGRPVMVYGLTRTFRDGFLPMVTNFRSFKMAAKEAKLAGTALDMVLDSRAMAIADIMDDYGRGSRFERAIEAGTRKFGVVSLMAPWNSAIKQFVGVIAQSRILQSVERVVNGKASKAEIEYLAANGIDANMADRIWKQFDQHGTREDVWSANTSTWTDRQATESIRAALVRDIDRTIITPGQDKPLWMSTELGKIVGQFRSFNIASVQRTMIAGLQQRDAAALNGAMLMLALGALSYKLKMDTAGFEVSDDPTKWAVEAFDRSGLAGWLMDANNIAEKLTRGAVGASALTGEQASRYASRNALGALLGPSFDAVGDAIQLSGSFFANDWTAADSHVQRKMIPGQNLFYLRWLFDAAEASANQALGIPARRQSSSARSTIR